MLLDTTVTCLVELGYVGTTGPAVAERAGLSRGAQLHHFGTRDQMVVAAVEHLANRRLQHVRHQLAELVKADEQSSTQPRALTLVALELLAEAMSGPLYGATLELWAVARTNEDLRVQLVSAEDRVHSEMRRICRTWVTPDPLMIQLTLDFMLGRGVSGMLVPHSRRRQRQALEKWIDLVQSAKPVGAGDEHS